MRVVAALLVAAAALTATGVRPAGAGACGAGSGGWTSTRLGAWVADVARAAGARMGGCTASAWVVRIGTTDVYIWATTPWKPSGAHSAGGTRIVLRAGGAAIWIEAGPTSTDTLPPSAAVARLQRAAARIPRVSP